MLKLKLLITIFSLFIISCSDNDNIVEETTERWLNHIPKTVKYYIGDGGEQEIFKIVNYYENGQIEYEENYKPRAVFKRNDLNYYHTDQPYEYISYYENGQTRFKGNYIQRFNSTQKLENYINIRHGEFVSYYENGQTRFKGNYVKGYSNGQIVSYYENGQIKYERNYLPKYIRKEVNKLHKVCDCDYEESEAEEDKKDFYLNCCCDGKSISYYENGQIEYERNYKDGKLEGKSISYYENGQIKYEENYKDGKKVY